MSFNSSHFMHTIKGMTLVKILDRDLLGKPSRVLKKISDIYDSEDISNKIASVFESGQPKERLQISSISGSNGMAKAEMPVSNMGSRPLKRCQRAFLANENDNAHDSDDLEMTLTELKSICRQKRQKVSKSCDSSKSCQRVSQPHYTAEKVKEEVEMEETLSCLKLKLSKSKSKRRKLPLNNQCSSLHAAVGDKQTAGEMCVLKIPKAEVMDTDSFEILNMAAVENCSTHTCSPVLNASANYSDNKGGVGTETETENTSFIEEQNLLDESALALRETTGGCSLETTGNLTSQTDSVVQNLSCDVSNEYVESKESRRNDTENTSSFIKEKNLLEESALPSRETSAGCSLETTGSPASQTDSIVQISSCDVSSAYVESEESRLSSRDAEQVCQQVREMGAVDENCFSYGSPVELNMPDGSSNSLDKTEEMVRYGTKSSCPVIPKGQSTVTLTGGTDGEGALKRTTACASLTDSLVQCSLCEASNEFLQSEGSDFFNGDTDKIYLVTTEKGSPETTNCTCPYSIAAHMFRTATSELPPAGSPVLPSKEITTEYSLSRSNNDRQWSSQDHSAYYIKAVNRPCSSASQNSYSSDDCSYPLMGEDLVTAKSNLSNSELLLTSTDVPRDFDGCDVGSRPTRLLSTRKAISPSSQEKLLLAVDAEDIQDTRQCSVALSPEEDGGILCSRETVQKSKLRVKNGSLTSAVKGILKAQSTECVSIQTHVQQAIAFSRMQMRDFETLTANLFKDLRFLKNIVEDMHPDPCLSTSSKYTADMRQEAIDNAVKREATTRRWLAIMSRDCNRFCKIMTLSEEKSTSPSVTPPKQRKKISFADEAGYTLCEVKTFVKNPQFDPEN